MFSNLISLYFNVSLIYSLKLLIEFLNSSPSFFHSNFSLKDLNSLFVIYFKNGKISLYTSLLLSLSSFLSSFIYLSLFK